MSATFRALPGLGVTAGTTSDARYVISKPATARTQDQVFLTILGGGFGHAEQLNREVSGGPGGAVMLSGAEPSTTFGHGGFVTLTLPRAGLQDLVPDLGSALVRPIHDGVEALRMLKGYLRVLTDGEPLTSKDLGQAFATHVLDLTALAVGACGDRGELAGRRGLRAARLEAVLRVIRTEYSDPHIAPDRVARRLGISTRYLHHLLQETGTSFAERVQTLRL